MNFRRNFVIATALGVSLLCVGPARAQATGAQTQSAAKPAEASKGDSPTQAIGKMGLGKEKQALVTQALKDYQKKIDEWRTTMGPKGVQLQKRVDETKNGSDQKARGQARAEMEAFNKAKPTAEGRDQALAVVMTPEEYAQYRELVYPGRPLPIETFSDSKIEVLSHGIEATAEKVQKYGNDVAEWRFAMIEGFTNATRTLSVDELGVFLGTSTKRKDLKQRTPGPLTTGQTKRMNSDLKKIQQELVKSETTGKRREILGKMIPELTGGPMNDFKLVLAEEIVNAKH